MLKSYFTKFLIVAVCGISFSCATLFSGTSDFVTINSEPQGAKILIEGIDYGKTPATVSITRPGFEDKQVVLELEGYESRTFNLQKKFNSVAILNLGSLLGWVVDIASGAIYKYDPLQYKIELKQINSYNLKDLNQDKNGAYVIPTVQETILINDEKNNVSIIFFGVETKD